MRHGYRELRFLTTVCLAESLQYISEIAPAQIRGSLLSAYACEC